jgi:acid phosphatase (class A)
MGVKVLAAAAALAIVGSAAAQPRPQGYLGDRGPDTIQIVPPAPKAGDPRDEADKGVFLATRKLKDGPRWALAQNDVNAALMMKDMSCALGLELSPVNAPKTFAVMSKMRFDMTRAYDRPKDLYKRPRPYQLHPGQATCVVPDKQLNESPDYPSGHATFGWMMGMILAELAPDRATQVLARGRAFGESRMVCGVHSLSAIEESRTAASAVFAALHGSPEFRADMDAARPEIAAARAIGAPPDPAACAREAELTKSPF